jgi:nicotinamidase-related amidase
MNSDLLIVIDVQKGFVNRWTAHLLARVEALQAEYGRVVATRFVNPPGSLYRRLMGWHGFAPGSDDVELAFAQLPNARVMDKTTYTCVSDDFAAELRRDGVRRVEVCGVATDNCVLKSAVDLFERGIEPVVLADFCASHGGPEYHAAGLLLARRFLGPSQVSSASPLRR